MIVQRRSNSHSHVSYFLAKPVHRGPTAREAPLRLFARISEFYRQALGADPGYNGVLTHNPMRSAHRHGEFLTHWGCNRPYSLSELAEPIPRGWRLPVKPTTGSGPELRSVRGADEVGGITGEHRARSVGPWRGPRMTAWTCRWEIAKWPESLRVSSATGDPGLPRAASTPRPSAKRGAVPWGCVAALLSARARLAAIN